MSFRIPDKISKSPYCRTFFAILVIVARCSGAWLFLRIAWLEAIDEINHSANMDFLSYELLYTVGALVTTWGAYSAVARRSFRRSLAASASLVCWLTWLAIRDMLNKGDATFWFQALLIILPAILDEWFLSQWQSQREWHPMSPSLRLTISFLATAMVISVATGWPNALPSRPDSVLLFGTLGPGLFFVILEWLSLIVATRMISNRVRGGPLLSVAAVTLELSYYYLAGA